MRVRGRAHVRAICVLPNTNLYVARQFFLKLAILGFRTQDNMCFGYMLIIFACRCAVLTAIRIQTNVSQNASKFASRRHTDFQSFLIRFVVAALFPDFLAHILRCIIKIKFWIKFHYQLITLRFHGIALLQRKLQSYCTIKFIQFDSIPLFHMLS